MHWVQSNIRCREFLFQMSIHVAQFSLWLLLKNKDWKNNEGPEYNFTPRLKTSAKGRVDRLRPTMPLYFLSLYQNIDMCVCAYLQTYTYMCVHIYIGSGITY